MANGAPPIVSVDGRWWWDGYAWRPTHVPPTPATPPGPGPGKRRRRVVTIVLLVAAGYVLLIGYVVGLVGWAATRGNPSLLGDFRIAMATSGHPEIIDYYIGGAKGRTTVVFAVHVSQGSGTDPASLLPEARALQAIVNREAPGYDGLILIRFRHNGHIVETVRFQAHDVLGPDSAGWHP